VGGNSKFKIKNSKLARVGGWNSEFRIPNSDFIRYSLRMFLRLLLLFTVVPLVELFLLVKLGTVIGIGATVLIVICTGVLGAWLARWQGLGVLRRLTEDLNEGRLPADTLIDGLLILIAGAVLLTPGLITDGLGFLLLVPQGRAVVRKAIAARFATRTEVSDPGVIDAEWYREE
jgi:UPF0716 protein FxsA